MNKSRKIVKCKVCGRRTKSFRSLCNICKAWALFLIDVANFLYELGRYIKRCDFFVAGMCTDGRNDFDGLCSPEACELDKKEYVRVWGVFNWYKFREGREE